MKDVRAADVGHRRCVISDEHGERKTVSFCFSLQVWASNPDESRKDSVLGSSTTECLQQALLV